MNTTLPKHRLSGEEIAVVLSEMGVDATVERIGALQARIDTSKLQQGERNTAVRAAVESANRAFDALAPSQRELPKFNVTMAQAVDLGKFDRGLHVWYDGLENRGYQIHTVSWRISHHGAKGGGDVWHASAYDNRGFDTRWTQHIPQFQGNWLEADTIDHLLEVIGVSGLVDPEPFRTLTSTGVSQYPLASHRRNPSFWDSSAIADKVLAGRDLASSETMPRIIARYPDQRIFGDKPQDRADVTERVLSLTLAELQQLRDHSKQASLLVNPRDGDRCGPDCVEIEASIRAFFGVDQLGAISGSQLDAARLQNRAAERGKRAQAGNAVKAVVLWSDWFDNPFKAIKAAAEARGTPEDYERALDLLRASAEWESFTSSEFLDDLLQEIAGETNIVCQYDDGKIHSGQGFRAAYDESPEFSLVPTDESLSADM